jgi:glycosyltransferase involved in cell wall biosynthesis
MSKILFFYTELAGYVMSCFEELTKYAEVHVVHWPINPEAPFNFNEIPGCSFYNRKEYDNNSLLKLTSKIFGDRTSNIEHRTSAIFCSGWVDNGYLEVCKHYFGFIPTVLTLDNHWNGSLKQHILSLISPFYLKQIFSNVWVPGTPQKQYALKLGYKEQAVKTGFYSANTFAFGQIYEKYKEQKRSCFPQRFIYAGRYIETKGIFTLWEAFIEASETLKSNWELWCLGAGALYDNRIEHPKIKHFGFVQPAEMESFLRDTGVFVLPSNFDPWGVVVQEFAAAGFPLLCSDKVGAASMFLKNGQNGYIFKAGDKESLKKQFLAIMQMDNLELTRMGELSHELGQQVTPATWAETVLSFMLM